MPHAGRAKSAARRVHAAIGRVKGDGAGRVSLPLRCGSMRGTDGQLGLHGCCTCMCACPLSRVHGYPGTQGCVMTCWDGPYSRLSMALAWVVCSHDPCA